MSPHFEKIVKISVISFIDGKIELHQNLRYQMFCNKITSAHESINTKLQTIPSVTLEYIDNAVVKSKNTTILISCMKDFIFSGQFFSLNKDPLKTAVKNEDFLLQIELEINSVDLDILDMFLINVSFNC